MRAKRISLVALLSVTGCVTDDDLQEESLATIELAEIYSSKSVEGRTALERLQRVAPYGSKKFQIVADVYSYLEAEGHLAEGAKKEALLSYRDAMQLAKGDFSRHVFTKWLELFLAGFKGDADAAAILIWDETRQGRDVDYFKSRGIHSPQELKLELAKITEFFPSQGKDDVKEGLVFPLSQAQVSAKDPLLRAHAAAYCRTPQKSDWFDWIAAIPTELRTYWAARVAHCKKEFKKAAGLYEDFILASRRLRHKTTGSQALESAYRLTEIYRWIDRRRDLAEAYAKMVAIWDEAKIIEADFDADLVDFKLRRINDLLWSARYAALVGEFDRAQQHAERAIKLAKKLEPQARSINSRQLKTLREYRAEGRHILAFRVAIERGQLTSALAQVELAMTIEGLDQSWKERLQWYRGFYPYLAGDYERACQNFESFLAGMGAESAYRDRVYYWLARSYQLMGQAEKADFYLSSLHKEYPASFYSVVPTAEADAVLSQANLDALLGLRGSLWESLKVSRRFELGVFYKSKDLRRMLARSLILVRARVAPLSQESVKRFTQQARRQRLTLEQWVYLSRLNHLAGNHFQAISLTAEISRRYKELWQKYPEQILVHYPMVYMDQVEKHSERHGVEAEDILAVTRQESSFRAQVRSPAGALGLMQLMPQTARKLLNEISRKPPTSIEEMLSSADENIALGAGLLKRLFDKYQGQRAPAFAAYNAGEFVVDIWLQRRGQNEPLLWVEVIPFGETQHYVKNVWRNYHLYKYLRQRPARMSRLIGEGLLRRNVF